MKTVFSALAVGASFRFGGNTWEKRSSRTAAIVKPEKLEGRWFYFGGLDLVTT
jgi:hypothetical protein